MLKKDEIEWHAEQLRGKSSRRVPVDIERIASELGLKFSYGNFDDKTISAIINYPSNITIRNDPRPDYKRIFLAHAIAHYVIYRQQDEKNKRTTCTLGAWTVTDREELKRLAIAIMVPKDSILEYFNIYDRKGCVHTKDFIQCESKTECLAKTFGIPIVAMSKRIKMWSNGELS